jgi:peptidoglycan/LPS O-acetylase OafA/YrhL
MALLLLLGIAVVSLASPEHCKEALIASLNSSATALGSKNVDDTALLRLAYSGKSPNDLGHFRGCRSLDNSRYFTIEQKAHRLGLLFGFCSPADCSKSDVEALLGSGMETTPIFEQNNISFIVHDETSYSISTGGFIVLLFLTTSLTLSLIGSYVDYTADAKQLPTAERAADPKPTLLRCFSLYNNVKKLFTSRSADTSSATAGLEVLNGVRVLSICWVILGHCFAFRGGSPLVNVDGFPRIGKQVWTAIGYGGFYAVDSFFWLSGFLMCYLTYQEIERRRGKTSFLYWVMFYLHRFLRLLPLYGFCMAFYVLVLPTLGTGPLWWQTEKTVYDCYDYWWTNFLFINNFYPEGRGNLCFNIGWYLANDMQFFWIAPLFILAYYKFPKYLSWVALSIGIAASILATCLLVDEYEYNTVVIASVNTTNDFHHRVYTKPYCRVVPFFFGLLIGFVYIQYLKLAKGEPVTDRTSAKIIGLYKDTKYGPVVSFCLGITLVMFFIFIQMTVYSTGPAYDGWSHSTNILFLGFQHLFFSIGLTLIVLPVLLNELPLILTLLGGKFWTPLARLNFACFMGHFGVMLFIFSSEETGVVLNGLTYFHDFIVSVVVAWAVAFPLSMLVEVPFMNLEKLIRGKH